MQAIRKPEAEAPPTAVMLGGAARLTGYATANLFRVSPMAVWASSRGEPRVSHARHIAAYLTHVGFSQPLTAVAVSFGRHRTTIGHACARLEDARDHHGLDHCLELIEAALRAHASVFLGVDAGRRP
jgi:hypothetical protein